MIDWILGYLFQAVDYLLSLLYDYIYTPVYNVLSWVVKQVLDFFTSLWDLLVQVFNYVVQFFVDFYDAIKDFFVGIFNYCLDWLISTFNDILSFFSDIYNYIVDFLYASFQAVVDTLSAWFTWVVDNLLQFFNPIWDFFSAFFDNLWQFLSAILSRLYSIFDFSSLAATLYQLFWWLLDSLVYVLLLPFCFILQGVLSVIIALLNVIDFGSYGILSIMSYGLPSQFIYFFAAFGVPQFLLIIAGAYLVRLLLNLIPSWATRV